MKFVSNSRLIPNNPCIMPWFNRVSVTTRISHLSAIVMTTGYCALDNDADVLSLTAFCTDNWFDIL